MYLVRLFIHLIKFTLVSNGAASMVNVIFHIYRPVFASLRTRLTTMVQNAFDQSYWKCITHYVVSTYHIGATIMMKLLMPPII